MKIIRSGKGEILNSPKEFSAIKIFENKDTEIIKIDFEIDGFFKKHVSPVDVWFYILEGKGEVEADETKIDVIKGDLIYSPKGTAHKIKNIGELPLEILVVKIPKSKESVIFVE